MVDDITNYVNGNSPFGFGDTPLQFWKMQPKNILISLPTIK